MSELRMISMPPDPERVQGVLELKEIEFLHPKTGLKSSFWVPATVPDEALVNLPSPGVEPGAPARHRITAETWTLDNRNGQHLTLLRLGAALVMAQTPRDLCVFLRSIAGADGASHGGGAWSMWIWPPITTQERLRQLCELLENKAPVDERHMVQCFAQAMQLTHLNCMFCAIQLPPRTRLYLESFFSAVSRVRVARFVILMMPVCTDATCLAKMARLHLAIYGGVEIDGAIVMPRQHKCVACQEREALPLVTKFKKCSSCRSVYYCSVSCQRAHWPKHRPECPLLTKEREAEGAEYDADT